MTRLNGYCFAYAAIVAIAVEAFGADAPTIPSDTAMLDIDVSATAKIAIADQEQGATRSFSFRPLEPNQWYEYPIRVTFADGSSVQRKSLVHGGQRVCLPIRQSPTQPPEVEIQTGHWQSISDLAVSPDGRYALTGSNDHTACLWELGSGKKLRTYRGEDYSFFRIAFCPDGKRFLAAGLNKKATLRDIVTGEQLAIYESHSGSIDAIAVHPSKPIAATASSDKKAILWDLQTARPIHFLVGHADQVSCVAFSPDGTLLASGSKDKQVLLWDVATGTQVRGLEGHSLPVKQLAFNATGTRIYSIAAQSHHEGGQSKGELVEWNAATGKQERASKENIEYSQLAVHPNQRELVAIGYSSTDGTYRGSVTSIPTFSKERPLDSFGASIYRIAFHPDGQRLLTASSRDVTVRDFTTGRVMQRIAADSSGSPGMAINADRQQIVEWDYEGRLCVWDPETGRNSTALTAPRQRYFYQAQMDRAGRYFAAVGGSFGGKQTGPSLCVWDVAQQQMLHELTGHDDTIFKVAISPDGANIASASYKQLIVWESKSGRERYRLQPAEFGVSIPTFSPDGQMLLVGTSNNCAVLYDSATGKQLRKLDGLTYDPKAVLFVDNHQAILAGSGSTGSVLDWIDVDSGKVKRQFEGDLSSIEYVDVDSQQELVLAGPDKHAADKGSILIWDAQSTRIVQSFRLPGKPLTGALFTKDGARILAVAADGDVLLLDIATGDVLANVRRIRDQESLIQTPEGLFDSPGDAWKNVYFRTGTGLEVGPAAGLAKQYRYPGLFQALLAGKRPHPPDARAENSAPQMLIKERLDSRNEPHTSGLDDAARRERLKQRDVTPEDRCVLEILAPDDAVVTIDGAGYGSQHRFTFPSMRPDQPAKVKVEVSLTNGSRQTRNVLLRGGQRIRLRIADAAVTTEPVLQTGHSNSVNSIAFDRSGRWMVTGSSDGSAILWDVDDGKQLRTFRGHGDFRVGAVAMHPLGEKILTGGGDSTAILWESATGKLLQRFDKSGDSVAGVAFTPDGRFALASVYGGAKLWDLANGRLVRSLQGGDVDQMALSADGRFLVTGGAGYRELLLMRIPFGDLLVLNVASGEVVRRFEGHASGIRSMALSPDGRLLASGTGHPEYKVFLWDVATGQRLKTLPSGRPDDEMYALYFGADSKVLAGANSNLFLWDVTSGKLVRRQDVGEVMYSISLDPGGKSYAVGQSNGKVVFHAAADLRPLKALPGGANEVHHVAFSADGSRMLSCNAQQIVSVWDAAAGGRTQKLQPHDNLRSAAFSPDGQSIAIAGGGYREATLWSASSGQRLRGFRGHKGDVLDVRFTPDGSKLLTAGGYDDHTAILWNVQTGARLQNFAHSADILCLAISPDGRRAATAGRDKIATLWDLESGRQLHSFRSEHHSFYAIGFSPDGRQLVTAADDATVWDVETGERLRSLQVLGNESETLPDASDVLGKDANDRLDKLAGAASEVLRKAQSLNDDGVRAVQFSPDGRTIVVATTNVARLYDWDSRKELQSFIGHEKSILSVAFRPDGRQLLTGSADGSTRLWDVATGSELARLVDFDAGKEWAVVTPGGLFDSSDRGADFIALRAGNSLRIASIPEFRQAGLLTKLWHDERPLPDYTLVRRNTPPVFRLLSPPAQKLEVPSVVLNVEIDNQGGGFGEVKVRRNELEAAISPQAVDEGAKRRLAIPLELSEGGNKIEVRLVSPEDRWTTAPIETAYFYEPQKRADLVTTPPPPADTCILELKLPKGASVAIDGTEYGAQSRFTYQPLLPGQRYGANLQVRLPDGSRQERTIALEGGSLLRLAFAENGATGPQIILQTGHGDDVLCAAYSADGRRFVTGSRDRTAALWDVASGRKLRVFGHSGRVDAVALSSDGNRLLTASVVERTATDIEGAVKLWDVQSGALLRQFNGFHMVAFSPDGREVLTANESAITYDAGTGNRLQTYDPKSPVIRAAYSSDGKYVVTGSINDQIVVWDRRAAMQLRELQGPPSLQSLAISPDGKWVLSSHVQSSGDARLAEDVERYRRTLVGDPPNSRDANARMESNRAILWNLSDGRRWNEFPMEQSVSPAPVGFSADGKRIFTVDGSDAAHIWDVETARKLHSLRGHTNPIRCGAFRPDGQELLTGAEDNRLIFWNVANGTVARTIPGAGSGELAQGPLSARAASLRLQASISAFSGYLSGVFAATFSPDGRYLLIGSDDNAAAIWDSRKGRQVGGLPAHRGFVTSVAVSLDGRWMLSGSDDDTVVIFDSWTGADRTVDIGSGVTAFAIHPNGTLCSAGTDKGAIVLFELSTGTMTRKFEAHGNNVRSLAFDREGRRLVSGGGDGSVRVWEPSTGNQLKSWKISDADIHGVAFHPDGRRILAAQGFANIPVAGTFTIFDAETGAEERQVEGHTDSIFAASYSPDGERILTASADATAAVWNSRTGEKLLTLKGHSSLVRTAVFSPDGRQIVTGSTDGTARLWDAGTGDELARLVSFDKGAEWLIATPEGLFDGSQKGREKVAYRVGKGLDVAPVDRFFQDFYYPGLLEELRSGQRPAPGIAIGKQAPPLVRLVTSVQAGPVAQNRIVLEVEAIDQGSGVRGPWLMQNGARVLVDCETERRQRNIVRRMTIPLIEGENRLEIRAASADGSWESEPIHLAVRYEKPLPKPDLYLLAVGIDRYSPEDLRLQFAASDAEAMARMFQQRAPRLYAKVHATLLRDQDASRANILRAIANVAERAQPQDAVILFLGGQGAALDTRYFYLPSDFARKTESLADAIRRDGMSSAEIGEALAAVPALKRVLIFDTCHSGRISANVRTARNPFALRGAIERLARTEGAFTIAATATSEHVRELPDLRRGLLAYTLLAGLRAAESGPLAGASIADSSEETIVNVLPWFSFASIHLPRLSRYYFGQEQEVQHAACGASFPLLPAPPSDISTKSFSWVEPAGPGSAAPAAIDDSPPTQVRLKPSGPRTDLYVLAIGVNRYAQRSMDLKFAAQDAKAIAHLFRERGSALFANVNVEELYDERATLSEIRRVLEGIAGRAQPQDTLLVFLAGHGTMIGQRYFFLPSDLRWKSDSFEEDIRKQGLAADVLGDLLGKIPARKRALLFDTCASGGVLGFNQDSRDAFAFRGTIERLGLEQGIFTIAASAASEDAQEIDALEHGVLTYALLSSVHAIDRPADGIPTMHAVDADGAIDVLAWLSFSAGQAPRITKRYLGFEQDVQVGGQGTSFPILTISSQSANRP